MPQSLELLRSSARVPIAEPLPERPADQNVIPFLNEVLQKAGLPQTIKPLEGLVLPNQTKENPFHVPESLTPEQQLSILYMAPGFTSVEIGQLKDNVRLHEFGMRHEPMVDVSLVVTLESNPDAAFIDRETSKTNGHKKVTVWTVYGIDKQGNSAYFGPQV